MRTEAVPELLREVVEETPRGERLLHCIQCGTCGGSCPSGAEMEFTPRAVFALLGMGERERVLQANTMWKCVSCYFCTSRCPQEIPITDIMYTLKRIAIREGLASDREAPALARAFTQQVDRYGRSFELGLASSHILLRHPASAMRMTGIGMTLLRRGRVALRPRRIRNLGQLQRILARAREDGGAA